MARSFSSICLSGRSYLRSTVSVIFFFGILPLLQLACDEEQVSPPVIPPPIHKQQDTTSHDVTWTTCTLGLAGVAMNILRDVYAINDTDVWVVGMIRTAETERRDSLGNWVPNFNAAHFDGKTWTPVRIWHKDQNDLMAADPLNSVIAFGKNDVFFFSEGAFIHWDGKSFTSNWITTARWGAFLKGWGSSPSNIFVATTLGTVTHFNGTTFKKIETGTSERFGDIYGSKEGTVWTGGYDHGDLSRAFVRIEGSKSASIDRLAFDGCRTLWISADTLYADVGTGIFIQSLRDTSHWRLLPMMTIAFPLGYIRSMRGTTDNDIFMVGDFATIIHYNGKSWYQYPFFSLSAQKSFRAVSVTQNTVFAVGFDEQNRGLIYIGSKKR